MANGANTGLNFSTSVFQIALGGSRQETPRDTTVPQIPGGVVMMSYLQAWISSRCCSNGAECDSFSAA